LSQRKELEKKSKTKIAAFPIDKSFAKKKIIACVRKKNKKSCESSF
jgi:hypothetical protein